MPDFHRTDHADVLQTGNPSCVGLHTQFAWRTWQGLIKEKSSGLAAAILTCKGQATALQDDISVVQKTFAL